MSTEVPFTSWSMLPWFTASWSQNGPLARAVPSSAISVANKSVNVSLESNKKAAKRGVYQKPYSLHFVRGCSHRHHLASNFNSHKWTAVKSVCGHGSTAYVRVYTMKHTAGVAVWRGLAVGQMELQNLFNENFVDSYQRNLSSTKLRRYTIFHVCACAARSIEWLLCPSVSQSVSGHKMIILSKVVLLAATYK